MRTKVNKITKWNQIEWKPIENKIFRMQQKIFQASRLNERNKMFKLQKSLIQSYWAKLLAIRQITQDNKGKNTAGVDGIKSIGPELRMELVNEICLDGKASPIRRTYISKPENPNELRPLGIPTIKDRIKQKLALLALEPQWEALFDPNTYAFRKGRNQHDAIESAYKSINRLPKYVLDADIEKFFDRIFHDKLLEKVNTFPAMKMQIKSWLKAGILNTDPFLEATGHESTRGTPQGSVISPLLANIALNGIEVSLQYTIQRKYGQKVVRSLTVIRYADDIIILHPNRNIIVECKEHLVAFLTEIGLSLNESKTYIAHTLYITSNEEGRGRGFEYLGFAIKQLPIGIYKRRKTNRHYKTLIMPSRKSVSRHIKNLKLTLQHIVKRDALIAQLNPKIIGWANYYRSVVSSRIFNYLDHKLLFVVLRRLKQIHRTRSIRWISKRYFRRINRYKWTFYHDLGLGKRPMTLARYATIKIKRHVKVKGNASIYDDNLLYWSKRLKNLPHISERT